MNDVVLLFAGLVGLWIGTELIVNGSVTVAKRMRLKETFIGFSVLAIGTDLPEIAVMLDASFFPSSLEEASGIIIGSALGSAIGQISLVLGTVALVGTLYLLRADILRHGGILIGATLLVFLFAFDGIITQLEGVILVLSYVIYFILLLKERHYTRIIETRQTSKSSLTAWLMIISGFVLLLGNAELTVSAALSLAHHFGLSATSVAVVIIGLGSSLPELSLSGMALIRKKPGLSLGNVLGSNILDTLLVPGIGAIISPLFIGQNVLWFDIPVLLFLTLFALYSLVFSKNGMPKLHAIFLIISYLVYIGVRFGRELI